MGLGGSAGAFATISPPARAAAATTDTVWRLNANWGFNISGRTRCTCNACHKHATNKVFRTRRTAEAARIHRCCVCQPYGLELAIDDVATLFSGGATAIDLRHGDNQILFEAAVARSLQPFVTVPAPEPVTLSGSPLPVAPPVTGSVEPVVASPFASPMASPMASPTPTSAADVATAAAATPVPTIASSFDLAGTMLPSTGSESGSIAAAALVAIGAGMIAVLAAGRSAVDEAMSPVEGP